MKFRKEGADRGLPKPPGDVYTELPKDDLEADMEVMDQEQGKEMAKEKGMAEEDPWMIGPRVQETEMIEDPNVHPKLRAFLREGPEDDIALELDILSTL